MAAQTAEPQARETSNAADTSQYLTFSLDEEEYGVDILRVQEIKGYVPTTRIPNAPADVMGVLNLRGTIVPIVDLRCKFGLSKIAYDKFTAIIVVVVQDRVMGVIVDRVSEVMSIPVADIQPVAESGAGAAPSFLQGMGKVGDKLIILLNIESVLLGDGASLALAA